MTDQNFASQIVSVLSESGKRPKLAVFWADLRQEIVRDRILYAIIILYLVAAAILARTLDLTERLVAFIYVPIWLRGMLTVTLPLFFLYLAVYSVRSDPHRPLYFLIQTLPDLPWARVIAGCLLFASMAVFQGTFTSVKNMLPAIVPFWADRPLADLSAALHGGTAAWRILQPLLGYPLITRAIEYIYAVPWLLLLFVIQSAIAIHPGLTHLRMRFFLSSFVIWIVLGNIMALVCMSAGPVYYGLVTGDYARFSGLVEYLSFSEGLPYSARELQKQLWTAYITNKAEMGTGISAFPSIHIAMATLFALVASNIDRRLGAVLAVFCGVILIGSVHLGWHYAIDGYVSALCTIGIWAGMGRLVRVHQVDC